MATNTNYNVGSTMYPADLMSAKDNQYGGNYVMFYINVHEDSFLFKEDSAPTIAAKDVPNRLTGNVEGMKLSDKATTAITGVSAFGAAKAALAITGVDSTVASAASYAGAAALTLKIKNTVNASSKYKRLQHAIALHVPTDLIVKYGAVWSDTDMAGRIALGTMAEGAAEAFETLAKDLSIEGVKNAGSQIGQSLSSVGNYVAGAALNTGPGELLAKRAGVAANPKKEQLFKQVDARSFNFMYQFFPRSESEAQQVREIIKMFKIHMHPEFKTPDQFLYVYPSQFDIKYFNNGKENRNLHRHTSCVLTDLTVQYNPQNVTSVFKDGMPTQINMNLMFRELAVLSRETIMDGY